MWMRGAGVILEPHEMAMRWQEAYVAPARAVLGSLKEKQREALR